MTPIKSLFILIFIFTAIQQVAFGFIFLDEDETSYVLPCDIKPVKKLSDNCDILKFYNRTKVDLLAMDNRLFNLSKECACELANMQDLWLKSFDDDPSLRRLAAMVQGNINKNGTSIQHPVYIWSDIEVTVYKISIYTSTKDYFEQQAHNGSMNLPPDMRQSLERDEVWMTIRRFCRKISRDRLNLYRYLENLNRASPEVFFRLVNFNEAIEAVYQASKSCKVLLLPMFQHYKLRPDNSEFVAAEPSLEASNLLFDGIDDALKYSSTNLLRCKSFQTEKVSLQALNQSCPMMMSPKVPSEWIVKHPSPTSRSMIAIKCGCQLLMHNSTWDTMMKDPNVQLMSTALTNYMNSNPLPDFASKPVWTIYGWFNDIMSRFIDDRDLAIRELVKTQMKSQDPTIPSKTKDNLNALELLRRGCNFIMFNYRKGMKEAMELKLIKYLDNLQLISQDPLFVFHLTLQDINLFKLHALSKLCIPIVK